MSQETVVEQAVPAPPASPRQAALGLFILFQLAFLVVSNLLGFIQWGAPELKDEPKKLVNRLAPRFADEQGHGYAWCDKVETGTRRWMQLTGQDQDWSLFSPSVGKVTGVPVVLLVWDEPTPSGPSIRGSKFEYTSENGFDLIPAFDKQQEHVVWLPSENAPVDEKSFLKIGNARLRRYEGQFYLNAQPYEKEARGDAEERMSRRMRRLITDSHDAILRYLEWRVRTWQHAHPDEPMPKQVILFQRFYRIRGPIFEGQGFERKLVRVEEPGWDGPFLVPQARWLPGKQVKEDRENRGQYLVEPFDYSQQRFSPMSK